MASCLKLNGSNADLVTDVANVLLVSCPLFQRCCGHYYGNRYIVEPSIEVREGIPKLSQLTVVVGEERGATEASSRRNCSKSKDWAV